MTKEDLKTDLINIFDYILKNKDISIDSIFNRDTLIDIRTALKNEDYTSFRLTDLQKQELIKHFINSNSTICESTPIIIKENEECIKTSISRDIKSINFIKNVPQNLKGYIIEQVLKSEYILTEDSPKFLKSNFEVALKSIRLDSASADFIEYVMKEDLQDKLVEEAIKYGYILKEDSCIFLKSNKKIVLSSIKKDISLMKYVKEPAKSDSEVFKYALLNGFNYPDDYLINLPVNCFLDYEVLRFCFEQFDMYSADNKICYERFSRVIHSAITNLPSIKTLDSVFETVTEANWQKYKCKNSNTFSNIFGKICASLRNNTKFEDSIEYIKTILTPMENELGKKYKDLYNAMYEYFNIYHSKKSNKINKLKPYQDIIASMSSLYVSKCKEAFKKSEFEEFHYWLKDYFVLRLDHPFIYKRIRQAQKRKLFSDMYESNDKEALNFINNIVEKYSNEIPKETIKELVVKFLIVYSKIESIIEPPLHYNDYVRGKKASKLINRLNSGYIKYDGPELINYKDIISYDDISNKFIYTGYVFSSEVIKEYKEYEKISRVFENIKKDISEKIKTIDVEHFAIDDTYMMHNIELNLPFNDEFFEFDTEVLNNTSLREVLYACTEGCGYDKEAIMDDDSFKIVNNLLVDNNLFWLSLFMYNLTLKIMKNSITGDEMIDAIERSKHISNLAKILNYDTTKYEKLHLLCNISECASEEDLAILGLNNVLKLYKSKGFTDGDTKEIINMAKELVSQMFKIDKKTVPFVSGSTMDYKYTTYDTQDVTYLTSGIDTDACFKINGTDNDFFHYCALNKNGVVIKITDNYGNFIARASGFRNGNCVFFNELRTIFDFGGNTFTGKFKTEQNDIIEVFKKACMDILNKSQNNPKELDKIEYVFVNSAYILKEYGNTVSEDVYNKIGEYPMNKEGKDWGNFISKTKYLDNDENYGFQTDYGSYDIICMASFVRKKIKPDDIKPKDVEALYKRNRNPIIVTDHVDKDISNKVNRIAAIKTYLDVEWFKPIKFDNNDIVILGDNFYIIYSSGTIINSCVLEFDRKAKLEYKAVLNVLKECTLDIKQIKETFSNGHMKVINYK